MLIKSVTVRAFKSYKEETTIHLTSGVNVVVGPNGAGKSNFVEAIKFALTEDYRRINSKAREALQHNGHSSRGSEPAMVEIAFDNRDRRLPFDTDTVTFRREFGTKKDRLLINGASVKEVHSFLETAGFTNPYFIIQQGKISMLAEASDMDRLNILKEIAGASLYDRNMNESRKLTQENEAKHDDMVTKINLIRERLQELEEQRKKLEKVATIDALRRSIEYVLCIRETEAIRKTLEKTRGLLSHIQSEWNLMTQPKKATIRDLEKRQDENSQELLAVISNLERLKMKKFTMEAALERLRSQLVKYTQKLSEYEQVVQSNGSEHLRIIETITKITAEKTALEKQIQKLNSSTVTAEEERLNRLYIEANAKLQNLRDRFKRFGEFQNEHERNDKIELEIQTIQRTIVALNPRLHAVEASLKDKTAEKLLLTSQLETIQEDITQFNTSISDTTEVYAKVKDLIVKLSLKQMHDLDKGNELKQRLAEEKEKEIKLRGNLEKVLRPGTMTASNSMEIVLTSLFEKETGDTGYYGTVISNITVNENVRTAVEVAAGPTLMYHIVRDHQVSKQIMAEFNRLKLPGQVYFFALDKIVPSPNLQLLNFGGPTYEPVTRLLDHIGIIENGSPVLPVIEFIFGRTLFCLNADIASDAKKRYQMNCITPDGDFYRKSGTLTGGYIKSSNSVLAIHDQWYKCKSEIEKNLVKLETFEQIKNKVQQTIDSELKKKERLKSQIIRSEANIAEKYPEFRNVQLKLRNLEESISRENTDFQKMKLDLMELNTRRTGLREELTQRLQTAPTKEERKQFQALQKDMKAKFQDYTKFAQKRQMEEQDRSRIRDRLERLELERIQLLKEDQSLKRDCQEKMDDLKVVVLDLENEIEKNVEIWNHLLETIPDQERKIVELKKMLVEDAEQEKKLKLEITAEHPDTPVLRLKITQLENQLVVLQKEIGTAPENLSGVDSKSTKYLKTKLIEANRKLKEYKNINLAELAVHQKLDEIRQEINKTELELNNAKSCIDELSQALKVSKKTGLVGFFYSLQVNFRDTFKTLVPEGQGLLVLHGKDFHINDMGEGPEFPDFSEDELIGAAIQVSFTSESASATMKSMHQLSGGQKAVVAVALILAIQKLDPVPVYLLDEVDAALDPAYRTAVASVIDELSTEAQFVCTTFRPEFVRMAKSHYGVVYANVTSHIERISLEKALKFVVEDSSSDSGTASDSFDSHATEALNVSSSTSTTNM